MIIENNKQKDFIPMNLAFFDDSAGEKTEKATPKKKDKARKEGQVAKSAEITTAFMFIIIFFSLKLFSGYMLTKMIDTFNFGFSKIVEADVFFGLENIGRYIVTLFLQVILIVAPIFVVAMVIGIVTNIIQVGWHPTAKPIKPKFSKLNPISGFKKIFSLKAIFELIKSLTKFAIIGFAIYNILKKEVTILYNMFDMDLLSSVIYIADLCARVGMTVGAWYLIIAFADFAYQKYKHNKDLKMTKQEVKEEYKQTEGDPQIKGQIRQRMREASMRRMMQELPEADVIITNPTHYAVALKYDKQRGKAPFVIGKGVDHLAQRIKTIAKEEDIPIVENKPLARAIYSNVDIGKEIPQELYQAVAEVLAYVYKLKNDV